MANKLRILTRNVARITGVTASSTAGAYVAANLLTSDKSEVWRATGKTATLSGSSATTVSASSLHLPHCNFSPSAVGRLYLYSNAGYTGLARDTGDKYLCPEPAAEVVDWLPVDLANAYEQGGGAWARIWFPETTFKSWRLEISDPGNLQTALEAADLVIAPAWSPEYDIEPGGAGTVQRDTDVQFHTAAGSLKTRAGIRFDELTLDLTWLNEADRKTARRLMRSHGKRAPFIVSLWPDDSDPERERAHSIYGLMTEDTEMSLDGPDSFGTKIKMRQI